MLRKIYIWIQTIYGSLFPKSRSKFLFKKYIKKLINFNNPQTLNEKLMYYKFNLYWKNQLVNDCADKIKVRDFVTTVGLGKILNPIYGVWSKPSEINWESLPKKFVLKLNSGSGHNIVCTDKDNFDQKKAVKLLKKWMKQKYGYLTAEQGIYSKIQTKVFAEKYIETENKKPPNDYKFFCSYGNVKLLYVASDRYDGHTKFDFYTPNWEWINVKNSHENNGKVDKPKNFDDMLQYASIISKRFPLVRIDFYNENGNIVFGEITFTHMGCICPFQPTSYDLKFGNLFEDVKVANKIL